jgi:hypothetical protein
MTEDRAPEAPDQDPPVVTTREQAVALIRAIERRCRGRLGSRVAPKDATPEECDAAEKGHRALIADALKLGDEAVAKQIDSETRRPCGYDFNETILAGPLDGQEHAYACPTCGVVGSYRAPMFPELVEA